MSKLTRKDKIKIFKRKQNEKSYKELSTNFGIRISNIKYLIALIKIHGFDILRKNKNRIYSKKFKQYVIDRILLNYESIHSVALDIGLISAKILSNWVSKYKKYWYYQQNKKIIIKTKIVHIKNI